MVKYVSEPGEVPAAARRTTTSFLVALSLCPILATAVSAANVERNLRATSDSPAQTLLSSQTDPRLSELLSDVLARDPELAAARAAAAALDERPAQAGALPDPLATLTGYVRTPETRVGPQLAVASLSQRFPGAGQRGLREQAATHEAAAAWARYEALRLKRISEARILYYEIAFLDAFASITGTDRDTLMHFEEMARARYASGVGLQQDVIRIQTEITKDDTKLLDIHQRRAAAVAALNALRHRFDVKAFPTITLPGPRRFDVDPVRLRERASADRPELHGASAEMRRDGARVALARVEGRPDITVGFSYAFVDPRDDPTASLVPIQDDGKDIIGLTVGITLPLYRKRLAAGVNEALQVRTSTEQRRHGLLLAIHRDVEDLSARLPLLWSQLQLLENVLVLQSQESVRSIVSAYSTGSASALDLLDAERVLLEARVAAARTRADYRIATARLEGVVAGPLRLSASNGGTAP